MRFTLQTTGLQELLYVPTLNDLSAEADLIRRAGINQDNGNMGISTDRDLKMPSGNHHGNPE